jgi:PAS domain S-box-containing protein
MGTQENYNYSANNMEKNIIGLVYKPTPSDRETEWDRSKVLLSKTDVNGNILYANESFIDVCGYDDFELMGKPHNFVRHPDMPKVIFKMLWEELKQGNDYCAIIKNMSKTGRYYWVIADFKVIEDSHGQLSYTSEQKSVEPHIIKDIIEPLYSKLTQIEKMRDVESCENYITGFLEEKSTTYPEYVTGLIENGGDSSDGPKIVKKKGFFSGFFADKQ